MWLSIIREVKLNHLLYTIVLALIRNEVSITSNEIIVGV